MGFTFAEPLLLQEILRQVGKEVRSPEVTQGLIAAMALVHSGLPVSFSYCLAEVLLTHGPS